MKLGVRFELRLLPRGEGDRTEIVRAPAGPGRLRRPIPPSSHLGARASFFEDPLPSAVLEAFLGAASRQTNNVRLGCEF